MPKGQPNSGYRMSAKRAGDGWRPPNGTNVDFHDETIQQSKFSINERFQFVEDIVGQIVKGNQPFVVVSGPGGLGKSYTVFNTLESFGLQDQNSTLIDMQEQEGISAEQQAEDLDGLDKAQVLRLPLYLVVKGYMTAKNLYRTLYENQKGIIVFDDCDKILKDDTSINLLKGALESGKKKRIITWGAENGNDLPSYFEFKGRIVIISNIPTYAMDQAIITRSLSVDLFMTVEQKIDRMQFLLRNPHFMAEYSDECKHDAIKLIKEHAFGVKELSLRTLIKVIEIRRDIDPDRWERLAEYTICGN